MPFLSVLDAFKKAFSKSYNIVLIISVSLNNVLARAYNDHSFSNL